MQQLSIRLGDTLYATCQLTDNGAPVSLDDIEIVAQLIDRSCAVVYTFGVTIDDSDAGTYFLDKLETSTLSAQKYTIQISYIKCSSTVSATAIELNIAKRITTEQSTSAVASSIIGDTSIVLDVPPCSVELALFIPLGSSSLITSDGQVFLIEQPS